jgi:hypothetical protein
VIHRSVSSELFRLLTKLTAFFEPSVVPLASGKRCKTQDHNFGSDSIKAEQASVENRTHTVNHLPAQRRIEKRNVEAERESRCRRIRSLTEVVARVPQTAPPHAYAKCDELSPSHARSPVPDERTG